jgi:hypothetical protein
MSDVVDIIDREASPADAALVAAVVASDFRFAYSALPPLPCGCCASTRRSLTCIPMNPRRMSNILNTKPELMRWRGLFDALMPFRRT